MSAFTAAWAELYAMQTETIGVAILATVTGRCTSKAAVISENATNPSYYAGTTGLSGEITLQMLMSDFTSDPQKNDIVTCNGNMAGMTLQVTDPTQNNGIWYITCGDISK